MECQLLYYGVTKKIYKINSNDWWPNDNVHAEFALKRNDYKALNYCTGVIGRWVCHKRQPHGRVSRVKGIVWWSLVGRFLRWEITMVTLGNLWGRSRTCSIRTWPFSPLVMGRGFVFWKDNKWCQENPFWLMFRISLAYLKLNIFGPSRSGHLKKGEKM